MKIWGLKLTSLICIIEAIFYIIKTIFMFNEAMVYACKILQKTWFMPISIPMEFVLFSKLFCMKLVWIKLQCCLRHDVRKKYC